MENNISKRFNTFCLISTLFLLVFSGTVHAQDSTIIRPPVTKKLQKYYKQVKDDSTKRMVELKSMISGLLYDLRYASTENFMKRLMYPENTSQTFLRLPAALALQKVQQELKETELGLKIFDAYRPYSVTEKFWELVRDERYVANPARGSGHNRGIAVDLTIVSLKTGKELDMGTGFDNFTDTAHHNFTSLSAEILQNRKLLRSLMEKHGFKALETEWWHYSLPEWSKFELLDISFVQLGRE
jgi:D-alanyl-D-alanine dipeptidase